MSLFFNIASIIATLSIALIGVWRGVYAPQKKDRRKAWWLLTLSALLAGCSIYIQCDNFFAAQSTAKEFSEFRKYTIGTNDTPLVKIIIAKEDSKIYAYYFVINKAKYPLRNLSLISPLLSHSFGDETESVSQPPVDVSPNDTAFFKFKVDTSGIFDIRFKLKWGTGHTIWGNFFGLRSKNKSIGWPEDNKVPKYVSLPDTITDNEVQPSKSANFRCQIIRQEVVQKLLAQQALIDGVKANDNEIDNEVDRRMQSLIKRAGGRNQLEKYLGKSLSQYKKELRPEVEELLTAQKMKKMISENVTVTPEEVNAQMPKSKK